MSTSLARYRLSVFLDIDFMAERRTINDSLGNEEAISVFFLQKIEPRRKLLQ